MASFIASTIFSVDEKVFPVREKGVDLKEQMPGGSSSLSAFSESISASASSRRKFAIRPVVLVSCFSAELLLCMPDKETEKTFFLDKTIHRVILAPISYNELNSALKESLRMEKTLIKSIDHNIPIYPSTTYFSADVSSFLISQNRLLGEVLKAQRKLEKHKIHGSFYSQKLLEAFLKKLCTFYIFTSNISQC